MTNKTNLLIAEFMGFEFVTVNYWGDDDETSWQKINAEWMDKVGMDSVGDYIVNVAEDKWQEWGDVAYHSSWEDLMPVWVKLNQGTISESCYITVHNLIDRGDINKCYQAIVDELIELKSLNKL